MKAHWIVGIVLFAQMFPAFSEDNLTTNGVDAFYFERLQSEEPNYFVVGTPIDNDDLAGDDSHIEFYLSIQYPITLWTNARALQPDRLAIVYNGLYDFYMLASSRYDSAPIISRRQNPGTALEWDLFEDGQFRLGYFHESNGQTLDREDGKTAFDAEVAQGGFEYALAQVSRGWDYVNWRYRHTCGKKWKSVGQLEVRQFLHRQGFGTGSTEDSIFWDPTTEQSKINDFDGLRLMVEQRVPSLPFLGKAAARLELKTGTRDLDALGNIGGRISLTWWNYFHFFYHNGYGKDPASYHLRSEYIGFGVEFR